MAITKVQDVGTAGTSVIAGSLVLTLAVACSAGDLLTVSIVSTTAISSVADSKGNTYVVAQTVANGTTAIATIATSVLTTPLASGDTITITTSGNSHTAMSVTEWSGVTTLDQVASATAVSTNPQCGITPTTTQAAELILGCVGCNSGGTLLPTAPYTALPAITATSTTRRISPLYQIASATGTFNPSGSLASSTWAGVTATFGVVVPAGGAAARTLLGVGS